MQAEIIAIGTELLLGQIVDTNSSWIGEQLALAGIDCMYRSCVGDNEDRIAEVLSLALSRSDAVITTGGLGPTQDDITRESIARVMGVSLIRDLDLEQRVVEVFRARGRVMSDNNRRQADVPEGALPIPQRIGSAPGLLCPIGEKVIYALPGVPSEMREMFERAVLADLSNRDGHPSTIRSRTIRTYGIAESAIAEMVSPRFEDLDREGPGAPKIAFLASALEGVKVRISVKAPSEDDANRILDAEEQKLRELLGDCVVGVDGASVESSLGDLLMEKGLTLGLVESFTAGMMSSRVGAVPGASRWFRGGVVTYASDLKFDLLGVPHGPVVSAQCAIAMADGARRLLRVDMAIATTGVAGPEMQEGQPVGTCFVGIARPNAATESFAFRFSGDRQRVRELGVGSALGSARRLLLS